MARQKEAPPPLFTLHHDYTHSLNNFITKVGNLREAVHVAIKLDKSMSPAIRERLTLHLKELDAAMHGVPQEY
jgi:hypothetical protein